MTEAGATVVAWWSYGPIEVGEQQKRMHAHLHDLTREQLSSPRERVLNTACVDRGQRSRPLRPTEVW